MYPIIFLFSIFLSSIASTPISDDDKEQSSRVKRNMYDYEPWKSVRPLAYFMDRDISDDPLKKEAITAAIKYISDRTCVDFVENATASEGIKFVRNPAHKGVYNDMERDGDIEIINLDDIFGNQVDVIIRELLLAFGFIHHLRRSDRDNFVNIDENAVNSLPYPYKLYYYKQRAVNHYLSVPYEYGSVLHFGPANIEEHDYEMNITTKNPDYQNTIGTNKVSFFDMEMLYQQYCSNLTIRSHRFDPPVIKTKIDVCKHALSAPCGNGGYPNPRNCKVCVCPAGFGGGWCFKRQDGYGANLNATSEWKTQDVNLVGAGAELRYKFDEGAYLISAPYSANIQVKITKMGTEHCKPGCTTGAAEIKLGDPRMSGLRICCPNLLNIVFETQLNPMPVLVYNRKGSTNFTFQYRISGYGLQ